MEAVTEEFRARTRFYHHEEEGRKTRKMMAINTYAVGSEVLTAVSTKMAVFWVVAPCSLVLIYSSRQQTACFKVTAKSYNVATRTAEPRRVKTTQNAQRSKTSNAVLVTQSSEVSGGEALPWP
jgi:hypothetical protein